MKKLSSKIKAFTVDLNLIGAVVKTPYQNRLVPATLKVIDKTGNTICRAEYTSPAELELDYNELIFQWSTLEDSHTQKAYETPEDMYCRCTNCGSVSPYLPRDVRMEISPPGTGGLVGMFKHITCPKCGRPTEV